MRGPLYLAEETQDLRSPALGESFDDLVHIPERGAPHPLPSLLHEFNRALRAADFAELGRETLHIKFGREIVFFENSSARYGKSNEPDCTVCVLLVGLNPDLCFSPGLPPEQEEISAPTTDACRLSPTLSETPAPSPRGEARS